MSKAKSTARANFLPRQPQLSQGVFWLGSAAVFSVVMVLLWGLYTTTSQFNAEEWGRSWLQHEQNSGSCAAAAPPGRFFNLSNWLLQLPISDGRGGVISLMTPALSSYASPFFYSSASDRRAFLWAPVNGAHTNGSNFSRSELREAINFNYSGTHVLSATLAVIEEPPSGKVAIGQVHLQGIKGACSVFSMLQWERGTLVSHVRDQACGKLHFALPGPPFVLGELFSYTIRVDGNVLSVSTSRGEAVPYEYSWSARGSLYFKAGSYVQEVGSSAELGARVAISNLITSHVPPDSAWPAFSQKSMTALGRWKRWWAPSEPMTCAALRFTR